MNAFVNFILICLLIYVGFRLVRWLFGPLLLKFLLRRINKEIENRFVRQQNAYQHHKYDPEYEREVHLSQDIKIQFQHGASTENAPPPTTKTQSKLTQSKDIDYVEFEEIP